MRPKWPQNPSWDNAVECPTQAESRETSQKAKFEKRERKNESKDERYGVRYPEVAAPQVP